MKQYNKSYYRVYGFNVISEMKLPELIKTEKIDTNRDDVISIHFSDSISNKFELKKRNITMGIYPDESWIYVKNVAKYYIFNGNKIVIDKEENASIEEIKAYLLGSVFGIIFIIKNIIALHGSCLLINNEAVVITGESGCGKSTLSTALRMKGYKFMSDDVVPLKHNYAVPGFPQQKLCRDVMESFGLDVSQYTLINEERKKYAIPVKENFVDKDTKLGAVFQISVWDKPYVEIQEVSGIEKITMLMDNIFRIEFSKIFGLNKEYFKKIILLVNKIKVYRILRPEKRITTVEQIEAIEGIIGEREVVNVGI